MQTYKKVWGIGSGKPKFSLISESYIALMMVSAHTYTNVFQDWPIFVYVARLRAASPNFDFKHKGS